MKQNFDYLTHEMRVKLKKLIKEWDCNGNIPVKYGNMGITTINAMRYAKDNWFNKYELFYLRDHGFVRLVLKNGIVESDERWVIAVEPTYLGMHYDKVAFTNLFLELKWLIPIAISLCSLFIK